MNTPLSRWVTLGLALGALGGVAPSVAARRAESQASFTVRVSNDAQVAAKELADAERLAAAVFKRAGVPSIWVNVNDLSGTEREGMEDPNPDRLSLISVHIQSSSLAGPLGLGDRVMGLAPGTGPDRTLVYVFYDRVKDLARRQLAEKVRGLVAVRAGTSQILGEMIAHEIGHVLNLASHTETGIMRGYWDLKDLQLVAYGSLLFTEQQAEVIQVEVARRSRGQEVLVVAEAAL